VVRCSEHRQEGAVVRTKQGVGTYPCRHAGPGRAVTASRTTPRQALLSANSKGVSASTRRPCRRQVGDGLRRRQRSGGDVRASAATPDTTSAADGCHGLNADQWHDRRALAGCGVIAVRPGTPGGKPTTRAGAATHGIEARPRAPATARASAGGSPRGARAPKQRAGEADPRGDVVGAGAGDQRRDTRHRLTRQPPRAAAPPATGNPAAAHRRGPGAASAREGRRSERPRGHMRLAPGGGRRGARPERPNLTAVPRGAPPTTTLPSIEPNVASVCCRRSSVRRCGVEAKARQQPVGAFSRRPTSSGATSRRRRGRPAPRRGRAIFNRHRRAAVDGVLPHSMRPARSRGQPAPWVKVGDCSSVGADVRPHRASEEGPLQARAHDRGSAPRACRSPDSRPAPSSASSATFASWRTSKEPTRSRHSGTRAASTPDAGS